MLDVRAIIGFISSCRSGRHHIDLDPIVLVGYATERDVGQLEIGGAAWARLLDGRQVTGKLR